MPVYLYRREDGSTFEYRQKFSDDPLAVDPETGQSVVRVIQPAGILFKGSGFYVNDSKGAKSNLAMPPSDNGNGNGNGDTPANKDSTSTTKESASAAKKEDSTPTKEPAVKSTTSSNASNAAD